MSLVSPTVDRLVEMEGGRKGFRPWSPLLYPHVLLSLFAVALAYAALKTGGVEFSDWTVSLLLVAVAAVFYLLRARYLPPPPSLGPWLAWTSALVPAFIAFQLLPLPIALLRLLSPERARLLNNLTPLLRPPGFAPLTINSAATATSLLTILACAVAFFLVRDVSCRLAHLRPSAVAIPLILIASIEAAIGLLQAGSGTDVEGTYGSFDHFAGLLEMVLPFAIVYGISLVKPQLLSALAACALFLAATLILLAVLYSGSRMGVAATLLSLLIMGTVAARKKAIAIAVLALAILLVIVYLSPDALIARFGGFELSKESRLPIWADTLHLIAAYPLFGVGLGNYGTAFLKFQTTDVSLDYNYAHNDYLQFTAELGIIGFALLAALLAAVFVQAVRAAKHSLLGLGCIGGIAAIALHSLADFNMYIPANAFVLAWISGIATGLDSAPLKPARPLLRRYALALSCLLAAGASFWIWREHKPVPKPDPLHALAADAAAPLRWCNLGDALLKSGNIESARYCFSKALQLAPRIPPVLRRAADFHIAVHEPDTALRQIASILQQTDANDEVIFDWYSDKKLPVSAILEHGMPPGSRAPHAFLRYLINLENLDDSALVWHWLLLHARPDLQLSIDYTNFLFGQEKYAAAAQAWARSQNTPQSDWIYNGDFETEPSASRFDWQIQNVGGVEVARDASIAHTGAHSLRIQFDGKENLTYNHVSNTAFIRPGEYAFEAYIRCRDINKDQGIGFHLFDPEAPTRLDVQTAFLSGATGWQKIEQPISLLPGVRLLQIQITRQPTWRLFNNNTTGTAWIDGVRLRKID